jgi:hypothetical protein
MNIPCFLGGMTRGLLGRNSSIQFRHCRKEALKDADVVLLLGLKFELKFHCNFNVCIGAVCDFRLGYGKVLSRKSKIIIVNRNSFSLHQVGQRSRIEEKRNLSFEYRIVMFFGNQHYLSKVIQLILLYDYIKLYQKESINVLIYGLKLFEIKIILKKKRIGTKK